MVKSTSFGLKPYGSGKLTGSSTNWKKFQTAFDPPVLALVIISIVLIYFFTVAITGTRNIALAITFVSLLIPVTFQRSRQARQARAISRSWPEVIDQLVSGIQSGLSLHESVIALSMRGPESLRSEFAEVAEMHIHGESFEDSMAKLKEICQSAEADQICETLILARNLGGHDVGIVLRLLGNFFRENLALNDEIHAKHGWIKNAAVLAASAPWLLLMILATQPGTRATYATVEGLLVLCGGVVATVIAFLWMNLVGRIPEQIRIFSFRESL